MEFKTAGYSARISDDSGTTSHNEVAFRNTLEEFKIPFVNISEGLLIAVHCNLLKVLYIKYYSILFDGPIRELYSTGSLESVSRRDL